MNINIEQFKKMIEDLKPKPIEFKPLNEFMEKGGNIENLHLTTSDIGFKEIKEVLTTKGILKILYSTAIPKDTYYLMNVPPMHDFIKNATLNPFKG